MSKKLASIIAYCLLAISACMQKPQLKPRLTRSKIGWSGWRCEIIPLANRLSTSFGGRHIAGQIIRSGTPAAPNYARRVRRKSRRFYPQTAHRR